MKTEFYKEIKEFLLETENCSMAEMNKILDLTKTFEVFNGVVEE